MAEDVRRLIGPAEGLQFEVVPPTPDGADLARCAVRLHLAGEPLWYAEGDAEGEGPIDWTWIDLLEYLGRWWPWLVLEEHYPIALQRQPLFPGDLRAEAERRWEDLPDEQVRDEDQEVYRFLCRHDLAMGLKGLFVPSCILLRQGQNFMVSAPANDQNLILPFDATLATLEEFGDAMARLLEGAEDQRSRKALADWAAREQRLAERALDLRSGLDGRVRAEVEAGNEPNEFWEFDPWAPWRDSEILAAARMGAGYLTARQHASILRRIRATPLCMTDELDRLAARLQNDFEDFGRPYQQGYWAAAWLREHLGDVEREAVDPESLLTAWGVRIEAMDWADCPLDAIAAWGPRHGPVILLNTGEGRKPAHRFGRRATLAHEICHLLLDRNGALPVAEVLGGRAPEYPEKRARAFAAEWLLPRTMAERIVRDAEGVDEALRAIRRRFEVGAELVSWQVQNAAVWTTLTRDEQVKVRRFGEFALADMDA